MRGNIWLGIITELQINHLSCPAHDVTCMSVKAQLMLNNVYRSLAPFSKTTPNAILHLLQEMGSIVRVWVLNWPISIISLSPIKVVSCLMRLDAAERYTWPVTNFCEDIIFKRNEISQFLHLVFDLLCYCQLNMFSRSSHCTASQLFCKHCCTCRHFKAKPLNFPIEQFVCWWVQAFCPSASSKHEGVKMCPWGKSMVGRKKWAEEKSERKREGSIFILEHRLFNQLPWHVLSAQ